MILILLVEKCCEQFFFHYAKHQYAYIGHSLAVSIFVVEMANLKMP